jgi:N-dimethylarginine dimethylaminohydrolase
MIDVDTAIINPTQLPFWFLEKLKDMGMKTIEVHPGDNAGLVNCLAIRPGRVVMQDGLSPRTAETLDKMGIEILPIDYSKLMLGGGGIHCSTSPLIRDPIE